MRPARNWARKPQPESGGITKSERDIRVKSSILKRSVAASVFLLASTAAVAQANSLEVAAGGGLASFHSEGTTTNKGKFDASASYNVLSGFSIGFEYGYSPIQNLSASANGYTVSGTDHLNSYGAVIRAGLLPHFRIDPYVVFAGGGVKETASATASGYGVSVTESASQSGGYAGIGGGVNAYITPHFGVRPEVRYQYVHIDGDHVNEVDITGTIFYTFGGGHHKR